MDNGLEADTGLWQKIVELGYPVRLIKIWEYYFGYCQAGFETYLLDNLQLVYSK